MSMDDNELLRIYSSLPDYVKKELDEMDKRILEVRDKPLEYFIEQFRNGKRYKDINMLECQKIHLASLYLNDLDNYRFVVNKLWNQLNRTNHDLMNARIWLMVLKRNGNR